jgi:hypothetical protein
MLWPVSERPTAEQFRMHLHPLTTSANLIRASIVITCYELLKDAIVDNLRSFLANEWNERGEPKESVTYRREVLALHRNPLAASVRWHVDAAALSSAEAVAFEQLRAERHRLAHELGRYVVDPNSQVDMSLLTEAVGIARSLSRFWGGIEVDCDPQFDGQDIDYDEIRSGTALLIENLEQVAQLAASMADAAAQDLAGEIEWS